MGIWVDHDPRLNTPLRPIVNQYREGKVKSTPVRGVKEYLKPYIYKQWNHYAASSEVECGTACLLHNEPASYSQGQGEADCRAEAKASLNRASELPGLDPKQGDLAMGRLKVG